MIKDYSFRKISKEEIHIIQPLWQKLNAIHLNDSVYFKEYYSTFTFEKRIEKFNQCDENSMMIEIVEYTGPSPVGYCITSIGCDGDGEIDSIYIDDGHRGKRIGDYLITSSIGWLQQHECSKIRTAVAHGHESVYLFYQKYGLFPRMTFLELKQCPHAV